MLIRRTGGELVLAEDGRPRLRVAADGGEARTTDLGRLLEAGGSTATDVAALRVARDVVAGAGRVGGKGRGVRRGDAGEVSLYAGVKHEVSLGQGEKEEREVDERCR